MPIICDNASLTVKKDFFVFVTVCFVIFTVDATRPQRKRTTKEHLEKKSGKGNRDSGFQVQMGNNGDGSIRQSWMETSGLWPMLHWE